MSNTKSDNTKLDSFSSPICYIMALCPFLMGLLHEYQIAIATIIVLIILIVYVAVKRELHFKFNIVTYLGLAMIVLSIVSVFAGIVKGEAIYGMLRVFSAGIWVIFLMQISEDEKKLALGVVPNVAVVMTIVSALVYVTGISETFLFEEERMAGFFIYSNTFSLYLLLAIIIYTYQSKDSGILNQPKPKKTGKASKKTGAEIWEIIKHYAYPVIMLIGILWSGSRTTFAITVVVLIVLAIRNKGVRIFYFVMLVVGIVGAVLFVLITGSTEAIGRFLTTSLESSTLLGRIIYWKDALGELIHYPLGMGYESFFFAQGRFQTGVYETLYVHNDWVQMAVDFGILFFAAFVALFIYQLVKTKGVFRFILIVVAIHMVMDFDMQFMIITWIVLLCMNWDIGKDKVLSFDKNAKKVPTCITLVVVSLIYAWLGFANFFYTIDEYEMSASWFPWGLRNQEQYLIDSLTAEEYKERAEDALKLYDMDAPALDVMALSAADSKNYLEVLDYKRKSLEAQRYRTEVYDDFVMMMDTGANVYKESGNNESYKKCVDALLSTEDILKSVEESTDPLAYKIYDKPNFELSDKSKETINKYKESEGK